MAYASITSSKIRIDTDTNVKHECIVGEHTFHIHANPLYFNLSLTEAKILVQKLSSIMTEKQL